MRGGLDTNVGPARPAASLVERAGPEPTCQIPNHVRRRRGPGPEPGAALMFAGKEHGPFSEGLRLTAFTVGSGLPPRCTTPGLHAMALAIIYQRGVTNVRGWVHRQPPWVAPVIHCSSTVEPTVIGHARTSDAATSSAAASGPDHQVLATIARLRKKWTSTSHV